MGSQCVKILTSFWLLFSLANFSYGQPREAEQYNTPLALFFGVDHAYREPYSHEVLYDLVVAEYAYSHDDIVTATAQYHRLAQETRHPAIASRSTLLAVQAGHMPLALQNSELWVKSAPNDIEALRTRAALLIQDNQAELANHEIAAQLKRRPNSPETRMLYAQLLHHQERYEEAKPHYEHLLVYPIYDQTAAMNLAVISSQQGHHQKAYDYLQQVEDEERKQQMYYELGNSAEQIADNRSAQYWYQYVSSPPWYIPARIRSASIHSVNGDLDKARHELQNTKVDNDKERRSLTIIEAGFLVEHQQPETALALLSKALKQTPDDVDLLYARSLVAAQLDRLKVMETDLKLLLQQQPKHAEALNLLGYMLADRSKRYQEALGYIEKAIALEPDNPEIIDSMGWVQFRLGNLSEAEKYLRRANDMLPGNGEVAAHLGEVLWHQGKQDEAKTIWTETLELSPDDLYIPETMQRLLKH